MRESIKEFVKIVADTFSILEPIYEFGALQVPGQVGFADLRFIFLGKEYVGCDMREGPGVDKILNLHKIDLPSETVGTVLIMDTLEHVEFVRKAVEEAHRILKPDGIIVISSVMKFPIHDYPYDYWRFTPEGFKSLLRPFKFSFVDFAGDGNFPHTVVGIGFKCLVAKEQLNDFIVKFEMWKKHWYISSGTLWKAFVEFVTHPGFSNLYRKIRRR
jgi:SAM-dependent methyltransferase